ncbi:MAG: transporter substrate-binding domain-containing protein [Alphaproteobacteria bacterium]|nr:transporter substrate-binding domain-containing protein [Alphaproteobacteria bacterium]
MKKSMILGAIAALGLAAAPASAETMKFAADVGYAPHVMASPSGGVEGYNVDLTAEIAKRMGVDYEIIDQEWSGIFAGLAAGKYVAIIAPTTVTTERAEKMLFGEPYFEVNYQFLIKKGAPQVEKLEDLKGKTIAVNKGNFYDKWLSEREAEYGWKIERFGKNADAIAAVAAGRADANFAGDTVAGWTAKKNPLVEPSTLVISSGRVGAFAFDPSNAELRAKMEKIVECMKADGTVAKIHEKWTGQKPVEGGAAYKVVPGIGVPGMPGYDETPSGSGC